MKMSQFLKVVDKNKFSRNKVIVKESCDLIFFLPVAFVMKKGRAELAIDNSCEFFRVMMESAKIEVEYLLNKFVSVVWYKGQECMYGQCINTMAKKSSKSSYGKKPMGGKRKPRK